ncbi:MAG: sigma-54 dependent transcriptional regulator [Planctomycetota bacterium]|jgi:two-component system response regulator HydG|nr:sigma-54 dependent transcriptional regulator [Planctomycetota bacterium]
MSQSTEADHQAVPKLAEESRLNVLVVDDSRLLRETCAGFLTGRGHSCIRAASASEAMRTIDSEAIDVVLLDIGLPDGNGLDLLAEIKASDETIQVIIMTATATIENAVAAMRHGAADFVTKPIDFDLLDKSLRIALRTRRLATENRSLRGQVAQSAGITGLVGEADAMRAAADLIRRIAPSNETCLILGENGTGKEVVARAIHRLSERVDGSFVPVNCGAIAENLIESELFGHVRGAFSGADAARKGLIRQAQGGTLFLDEIGDMPLPMQVKLLRALENREVVPVGADHAVPCDIRVVAATNVDLHEHMAQGKFREDLYYRLNVMTIVVPPLRERTGDIPLLVAHILAENDSRRGVSPEAMDALESWPWPGNVRELQNTVRRACVLADDEIHVEHLPPRMVEARGEPGSGCRVIGNGVIPLSELERQAIKHALAAFGGDRARSARALGIDRTTLYRKLQRMDGTTESES